MPAAPSSTVLKLSCPDRVGLLAQITSFVAAHGGNLTEVHQFTDALSGWFFARLAIDCSHASGSVEELRTEFDPLAAQLRADWTLREESYRQRVALLVSKTGHCLADLLWRWKSGDLSMDIPVVISNHEEFRPVVEREGLRFEYVPISPDPEKKRAGFEATAALLEEAKVETVVLARYMQILPDWFCERFSGRVINIHHSFLPSFIGANPYQRAFARGVKLIGATCHYVTATLDDGPIIEQEVHRVEHYHTPADLLRMGQDCERLALARGLRYHVHDRVLIHGNKTIVFRD